MVEIIFATKNKGKMREIHELMKDSRFTVISMEEAGIDLEVVEDGQTFEENAMKKARAVMEYSGKPALADDSGLEIDYLDKQPGVLSARFLGEDTPYTIKNNKILDMLAGVADEKRSARFVSVIAYAAPDGTCRSTRATIEGVIAKESRGTGGFGYDPIFYIPQLQMTAAELSVEEKNMISHRGKALSAMKEKLEDCCIANTSIE